MTTQFEGDGLPIGVLIKCNTPSPPDGYLFADGAEVSRARYATLFKVTGTTCGAGDGVSTFNLPDLRAWDNGPTRYIVKAEPSASQVNASFRLWDYAQLVLDLPAPPELKERARELQTLAERALIDGSGVLKD